MEVMHEQFIVFALNTFVKINKIYISHSALKKEKCIYIYIYIDTQRFTPEKSDCINLSKWMIPS